MHRLAFTGLLSAILALASCSSGAGRAGATGEASGSGPGAAALPPVDGRNPAITETATFALG